jgi:hypothetical protein
MSIKQRVLSWLGKRVFFRLARFCLYHARGTQWCWICGAAPGMGPIWAGPHMTCNECHARWRVYHNDRLVVDWRGLGRPRPSCVKSREGATRGGYQPETGPVDWSDIEFPTTDDECGPENVRRSGPEWAKIHGGISGRCATNPEDVPDRLMTEAEFWQDYANRNSS